MSIISTQYGAKTALTIALASLAASPTTGRQATPVDNTVNNALDVVIQGVVNVGVVAGDEQVLFFVAGSFDGGNTYSLGNGANVIGAADAAFTRQDPCGKVPWVLPTPAASVAYTFDFSVAQMFGGVMPDHWCLVVFNDTGVALAASGNSVWYKEIRASDS